jgi:hypothetical protein
MFRRQAKGQESRRTGITRLAESVLLKHLLAHKGSTEYRQLHAEQKGVCSSHIMTRIHNFHVLDFTLSLSNMNQIRRT